MELILVSESPEVIVIPLIEGDERRVPNEKYNTQYSYKKELRYFSVVATIGPLIVGMESRAANTNILFIKQIHSNRFVVVWLIGIHPLTVVEWAVANEIANISFGEIKERGCTSMTHPHSLSMGLFSLPLIERLMIIEYLYFPLPSNLI